MSVIDPARRRRERRIAAGVVLAVALAGLGVVIYNKVESAQLARQNAYVPKQAHMTPEIVLLQQYIRIDTTNPPGNELPAAQWLSRILASHGVHAEIIESAPRRASLYARIKGKRPNEGLMLLHHIDVVSAVASEWTRPPYSGALFFNQIYGRGAIDMKGVGICELRAFLDVAKSGRTPERDLVFLAVADEESGSDLGMRWLVEHRPDIFSGVRYALNEGGITEMMLERVTYYGIEIGTKQPVTVILRAPSREQMQEARIALEPWFLRRDADRTTPEVKRWMRELAPQRIAFRRHLDDVDRTIATGKLWELPAGYREMLQDSVWAEGVEQNGSEWDMRTHLLNLPDTNPDKRLEWLREKVAPFGVRIGEVARKEGPVPVISTDTPMFKLLEREAKRSFGAPVGTEILNKSFNDSRFLRKLGIIAYGISPFPVDFFQSETIHQGDERVRVDYFNQGVEFLRHVVAEYAFGQ